MSRQCLPEDPDSCHQVGLHGDIFVPVKRNIHFTALAITPYDKIMRFININDACGPQFLFLFVFTSIAMVVLLQGRADRLWLPQTKRTCYDSVRTTALG
jgi:hypothetical protein